MAKEGRHFWHPSFPEMHWKEIFKDWNFSAFLIINSSCFLVTTIFTFRPLDQPFPTIFWDTGALQLCTKSDIREQHSLDFGFEALNSFCPPSETTTLTFLWGEGTCTFRQFPIMQWPMDDKLNADKHLYSACIDVLSGGLTCRPPYKVKRAALF